MIVLKEINKIKSQVEYHTGTKVVQLTVDVTDELLVVWCDLYDNNTDTSYQLNFECEVEVLEQFSNDRILREISEALVLEWTGYATSVVTIH